MNLPLDCIGYIFSFVRKYKYLSNWVLISKRVHEFIFNGECTCNIIFVPALRINFIPFKFRKVVIKLFTHTGIKNIYILNNLKNLSFNSRFTSMDDIKRLRPDLFFNKVIQYLDTGGMKCILNKETFKNLKSFSLRYLNDWKIIDKLPNTLNILTLGKSFGNPLNEIYYKKFNKLKNLYVFNNYKYNIPFIKSIEFLSLDFIDRKINIPEFPNLKILILRKSYIYRKVIESFKTLTKLYISESSYTLNLIKLINLEELMLSSDQIYNIQIKKLKKLVIDKSTISPIILINSILEYINLGHSNKKVTIPLSTRKLNVNYSIEPTGMDECLNMYYYKQKSPCKFMKFNELLNLKYIYIDNFEISCHLYNVDNLKHLEKIKINDQHNKLVIDVRNHIYLRHITSNWRTVIHGLTSNMIGRLNINILYKGLNFTEEIYDVDIIIMLKKYSCFNN